MQGRKILRNLVARELEGAAGCWRSWRRSWRSSKRRNSPLGRDTPYWCYCSSTVKSAASVLRRIDWINGQKRSSKVLGASGTGSGSCWSTSLHTQRDRLAENIFLERCVVGVSLDRILALIWFRREAHRRVAGLLKGGATREHTSSRLTP